MIFLPIVQRELRLAARRRSSYRIRWWTAVIALGIGFFFLLLPLLGAQRAAGAPLFSVLSGYAFGLACLSGVFFTAQSLTDEKREGTLGLLFLTDLKGYDVVLGKFVARSLNAFYALLALLPAMALPVLLGGVTGGSVWRVVLSLINALFFSLAAGLCVSACMRDSQRAMGNTLGLLLLLVAALPILTNFFARAGAAAFWLNLACLSPSWAFVHASAAFYPAHQVAFWNSMLASHLLGWFFLVLASAVLPRTWQEKSVVHPLESLRKPRVPHGPRSARDAALLSHNPVRWLRRHELGTQWRAWAVVLIWAITVAGILLFDISDSAGSILGGYVVLPFGFFLKLLFALQACRFFAEGRRNGALELLLCTPLTDRELLRGQLIALWRSFLWPLVAFVACLFAPLVVQLPAAISSHQAEQFLSALTQSALSGVYVLRMVLDLFALCWVGMALALTMKNPVMAPALTVLLVLVLPSFICWADILVDVVLIAWGTSRCQLGLRRVLAQQYQVLGPHPLRLSREVRR